MTQKLKLKQLRVGNLSANKLVKTDGNGGIVCSDEFVLTGSIFPSTSINGDLFFHTLHNRLYIYDMVRLKWLSTDRHSFSMEAATINKSNSMYLNTGSSVHSSTNGILMPFAGTITSASLSNSVVSTTARVFELRVNNSITTRAMLSLSGSASLYDNNLNVDFNQGDIIQGYTASNSGTTLSNLILIFQVAWR